MEYKDIIKKASETLNLPYDLVDKVYKAYWRSIRQTISLLPLKELKSIDELRKVKRNFNIPSLGKLGVTEYKLIRMLNKDKLFNKEEHDCKED